MKSTGRIDEGKAWPESARVGPIEIHAIDVRRVEAAFTDISAGFDRLIEAAVEAEPRLAQQVAAQQTQQRRVRDLLKADRRYTRAEIRRAEAEREVAAGKLSSFDDTKIGPTPEQMIKGDYRETEIELEDQTIRRFTTFKNIGESRIVQLYRRGVIDEDGYAACSWYRNTWEDAGLAGSAPVARYEPTVPSGDVAFGHVPRTEYAVSARYDYRWARACLPPSPDCFLFELVVLDEASIADAAKISRIRKNAAKSIFQRAVALLFSRIQHLLTDRPTNDD
jgi:hypothetical protein